MKLDHLTLNELECYGNWNLADELGGDCDGIGYAWAAFDGFGTKDNEAIILVEDDKGFVEATTYHFSASNARIFDDRIRCFQEYDNEFNAEEDADEDADEEDYDSLVEENLA